MSSFYFHTHLVIKLSVWDAITGAQAVNLSPLFYTQSHNERWKWIQRERSAGTVHLFCCHLLCPAQPNFLWPEAVCWPIGKKKSCLNGNAENQFHTHAHTRAHVHTHIRAHRIFWFWLYTPFVQLGFVRFCVFDLSLMSFWMKHNLYQMNKACEWILQAVWLHISLYPLKYPFASSSLHPIFCVFCLVCWTGLDWTGLAPYLATVTDTTLIVNP